MRRIFSYSMSVVYLLLGIFLLVKGWSVLDTMQNYGLGMLFIVYGLFRAYRIRKTAPVSVRMTGRDTNANSKDSAK